MNPLRITILDELEKFLQVEIGLGNLKINEIADIPVDVEGKEMIVYVRKLQSGFEDKYASDKNYQDGLFVIGIRSYNMHSENNVKKAELIIFNIQQHFKTLDLCNGIVTRVTQSYGLSTKDNKDRYFYEFNLKVTTR